MRQLSLRYALRSLGSNPVFVAVAVLSLSLGIGANTAIFSLVDQLLLRMLPVKNPQELVQMAARGPHNGSNWGMNAMSYPMYRDFRDKAEVFAGVVCRFGLPLSLSDGNRTERARGELVSGNYFDVLGVGAAIGRTIGAEDDVHPGGHPVVVLSYDYWKSRFASDPAILGRSIRVNDQPVTVIGVARKDFYGVEVGDATQVFIPIMMQARMLPNILQFYGLETRRGRWVNTFARLKPGVTVEQAKSAVAPLYKQIIEMEVQGTGFEHSSDYVRKRFLESRMDVMEGSTGRSYLRRQFTTPLYVLMSITGLVLLIACANVANLLIARASGRRKEIAVRLALGASRAQIVGQLLLESLLLSLTATIVGIALGIAIVRFLLTFVTDESSTFMITGQLDWRIFGFSAALAIASTFIFGLVPALQSTKLDLSTTLKDESGGVLGGGVHARFRKALVVVQVGLSLLLLIASGLFVKSLANLRNLDPGFETQRLLTFAIDPGLNGYSAERTEALFKRLTASFKQLPGVQGASFSSMRLLDGNQWDSTVTVEGYRSKEGEDMNPHFNAVSPGFFETLQVPIIQGRDFSERDNNDTPKICIVNEIFARKYFPDGLAVGRHIGQGGDSATKVDIEIVGVVKDMKYENLRDNPPRQVFVPLLPVKRVSGVTYYVRTSANPAQFYTTVRSTLRSMDSNLPLYGMRTLQDQLDRSLVTERMIATLSSAFGILATVLAIIGLYGVMTSTITKRSREIGIRMALGAQPQAVIRLVLAEVLVLVAAGVALALPAYFALARFVQSQLYGITISDASTLIAATILISGVALLAGFLPARRAARVDPIQVLRYE